MQVVIRLKTLSPTIERLMTGAFLAGVEEAKGRSVGSGKTG
jgi:hypothetical protein